MLEAIQAKGTAIMSISRRGVLRAATTAVTFSNVARGETRPIRIGVVTDMNGPYADFAGLGVVIGARLAAEEFPDGVLSRPIEILSGDHQAKPDVASTIARGWIDTDGVSAIVEGGHSGSGLALQKVAQEKTASLWLPGQRPPISPTRHVPRSAFTSTATPFHWRGAPGYR